MLIAEPVSRSSSLLSHRRSLLWLCTAGFCGSEVMTAIKGCPLMSASRNLLPQLCHLVPQGGVRWLPIYFFTLIAAYKYGWRAGMLTAVASPLINSALFGMPAADTLPPILFKSSLLAVAAGLTAARCRRVSLPLLAAVVLGYQAIGTLGEWAMTGSLRAALQDFRIGLPGMSLQILGGWAFMRWVLRR